MKYRLIVIVIATALCGCTVRQADTPPEAFNPVSVAGQTITSNNWSKSDPSSGKVINETEDHWDIAFPIPDAIQGGEKPDHRIVRVSKQTKQAKELGID